MGQAKRNQRDCPVVGHRIPAVECGESRASRYACPADCPHNPWAPANYARSLEIEDGLKLKTVKRLFAESPAARPDTPLAQGDPRSEHFFITAFYRQRDAGGLTFSERWGRQGWPGLNNDERFLLQWLARLRVGVIEVHRVLDGDQCEAVDLLEQAAVPFVVHDRSLAARAVRFSQLVAWTFPLPHYHRIHGVALAIPEVAGLDGLEVVRTVAQHLGGPGEGEPLREWLTDQFPRLAEAFDATATALHRRMLETLDAKWCSATYRLRGQPAEVLRRLDGLPCIAPTDLNTEEKTDGFTDSREWYDEPAASDPQQIALPLPQPPRAAVGRPLLGRLLVAADRVRLDASSAARYQALRAQFEKRLGRLVEFSTEHVNDLGARMLEKTEPADSGLVPPRLLEGARHIVLATSGSVQLPPGLSREQADAYLARREHEKFLDNPVPALGGRTPRQAAADPAGRPALVRLMKEHVRFSDEQNLRRGGSEDINWMLRELGLTEILFDPPPPRPRPAECEEDPIDHEHEAEDVPDETLPPPPPLPPEPMSPEEIDRRMQHATTWFEDLAEAIEEFETVAPEIGDLVEEFAGNDLSEAEWTLLMTEAANAWFVFFPPDCQYPAIDPAAIEAALARELERFGRTAPPASAETAMREFDSPRQPVLSSALAEVILEAAFGEGPKGLVRRKMVVPMLVLLKVLVDQFDELARRSAGPEN